MTELIRPKEALERLKISRATLSRMVNAKQLTRVTIHKNCYRYKLEEIKAIVGEE